MGPTFAPSEINRVLETHRACSSLRLVVLGEQEAVVLEVKPWDVHGVGYVDVSVVFPDRAVQNARLGAESIPKGLEAGERVMVSRAVNMIVAIRRI
jgi:hypothetical protein